jgi:hypothetical protein
MSGAPLAFGDVHRPQDKYLDTSNEGFQCATMNFLHPCTRQSARGRETSHDSTSSRSSGLIWRRFRRRMAPTTILCIRPVGLKPGFSTPGSTRSRRECASGSATGSKPSSRPNWRPPSVDPAMAVRRATSLPSARGAIAMAAGRAHSPAPSVQPRSRCHGPACTPRTAPPSGGVQPFGLISGARKPPMP